MPDFISENVNIYYEENGDGFPVILIHGLMGSIPMSKHIIDFLKDHYRVIAFDCRGHGKSSKPPVYSLRDHINDVVNLMNHLNIESGYIMGVSMGSYIAQGVTVSVPQRVEKLILVAPKSNGKTSSTQALFTRHAEELEGLDVQEKLLKVNKYIWYNLTAIAKVMEEFKDLNAMLTAPEEQAAASKALEGFDFRNDLNRITAPTLIISGKHDGLNPPDLGREIKLLIPNSTFIEFKHSGHSPDIEEPRLFRKTILDFLAD
jgi:3-oxoadipate enol-lactonase